MSTPQSEIDKLLNQAKAIECTVDKYPIFYDSLAFSAAMAIVEYEDPALLDKLPSWISEKIHEMRDIYLEQKATSFIPAWAWPITVK